MTQVHDSPTRTEEQIDALLQQFAEGFIVQQRPPVLEWFARFVA